MMYEDFIKDFSMRTFKNLKTICEDNPDYEVTQLLNSCLGLLVFPKEEYFDTMWKKIVAYCAELGFAPANPILFNQIESVLMEINNSSAITIIGRHMRNATMYDVKFIPFSNGFCYRRISLCHKRDNNNPAIGILKTAFKERFAQKYDPD